MAYELFEQFCKERFPDVLEGAPEKVDLKRLDEALNAYKQANKNSSEMKNNAPAETELPRISNERKAVEEILDYLSFVRPTQIYGANGFHDYEKGHIIGIILQNIHADHSMLEAENARLRAKLEQAVEALESLLADLKQTELDLQPIYSSAWIHGVMFKGKGYKASFNNARRTLARLKKKTDE